MESNTQADDDSQINCVIEPFYFIDDLNEFWWRLDAPTYTVLAVTEADSLVLPNA